MAKTQSKRRRGPAPMDRAPEREPITLPPGGYELVEDGGEAPEDELLDEVLTRLEGNTDSFCVISKISVVNGQRREAWCFETPPTTTLEQEIQSAYGEGDYRVRVYQRRQTERGIRPLLVKNVVLPIGPSRDAKGASATALAVAVPAPTDRVAELVAEMRAAGERANERMQSFMLEMVKALAANKSGGNGEVFAQFKDFAAGIGALPKAEKPKDPLEQLGILWALIEKVRGGGAPVVNDEGEVPSSTLFLEGIKTVRELVTNARGGAAPGPVDASAAHAALPAAAAATPSALPAQPAPAQAAALPEDEDMQMLKLYIRRLIKAARAAHGPDEYAEEVYGNLDEQAAMTLQSEQWMTALELIEPIPQDVRPWFARLREAVIELVREDAGTESPQTPDGEAKKDGGISQPSGNGSGAAAAKSKRVGT